MSVIRMDGQEFKSKLFPNKSLPRITVVYDFIKENNRAWMPVITLLTDETGEKITGYRYLNGSHTAFAAPSLTEAICFMVPVEQVPLFSPVFKPFPFRNNHG